MINRIAQKSREHSLVTRGGWVMASILSIALLSMMASLVTVESTDGDAGRINIAGSLRMLSFRIANAYLLRYSQLPHLAHHSLDDEITAFDAQINQPLLNELLGSGVEPAVRDSLRALHQQWTQLQLQAQAGQLAPQDLEQAVQTFVSNIDAFVLQIQHQSEHKIHRLRWIQGLGLALTISIAFVSLVSLYRHIAVPLKQLVRAAQRAQQGDLSQRVRYDDADELGELGRAYNLMADNLSQMYQDLENKVAAKTAQLQRRNEALQLLYNTIQKLTENPNSKQTLRGIVNELRVTTGLSFITLCLNDVRGDKPYEPIILVPEDADNCAAVPCQDCTRIRPPEFDDAGRQVGASFPVRDKQNDFGVLAIAASPGASIETWQLHLVSTVTDAIATALSLAKQNEQEQRLLLMEERTAIARELHDSLAQSLSYLKVQVTRFQSLLSKGESADSLFAVSQELRDGLNAAYSQLRELLTTFRLKINEPGLEQALKGTVAEFSQRGNLAIELDYGLRGVPLTANEEIHLLQIIREALSNVIKHARASHAHVSLELQDENQLQVRVTDNGIGAGNQDPKLHHHGLAIMRERAGQLDGAVNLINNPDGGATLLLQCSLGTRTADQVIASSHV